MNEAFFFTSPCVRRSPNWLETTTGKIGKDAEEEAAGKNRFDGVGNTVNPTGRLRLTNLTQPNHAESRAFVCETTNVIDFAEKRECVYFKNIKRFVLYSPSTSVLQTVLRQLVNTEFRAKDISAQNFNFRIV